jgi:hypothetical protein
MQGAIISKILKEENDIKHSLFVFLFLKFKYLKLE